MTFKEADNLATCLADRGFKTDSGLSQGEAIVYIHGNGFETIWNGETAMDRNEAGLSIAHDNIQNWLKSWMASPRVRRLA